MRILVTGATGLLGSEVFHLLKKRGHTVTGCSRSGIGCAPLDIRDGKAVERCFEKAMPEAVIHCAAWTAVDLAEDAREEAWAVNVDGTRNIAACCRSFGCRLIYISTDYVFGDQKKTPWLPEDIPEAPLNVYGRTKLAGEQAVLQTLDTGIILRTGWLFGRQGDHFVKTMLRLADGQKPLRVVNDQVGRPTYSADLALLLEEMVRSDRCGCYHATNEGSFVSWYDFACEIFRQAGREVPVQPVTSEQYKTKARRPHNCRLDTSGLTEAGFSPLPDWTDALSRFLRETEVL